MYNFHSVIITGHFLIESIMVDGHHDKAIKKYDFHLKVS